MADPRMSAERDAIPDELLESFWEKGLVLFGERVRQRMVIAELRGREHDLVLVGEPSQHFVEVADEREAFEHEENAHVVTADLIAGPR